MYILCLKISLDLVCFNTFDDSLPYIFFLWHLALDSNSTNIVKHSSFGTQILFSPLAFGGYLTTTVTMASL